MFNLFDSSVIDESFKLETEEKKKNRKIKIIYILAKYKKKNQQNTTWDKIICPYDTTPCLHYLVYIVYKNKKKWYDCKFMFSKP